MKTYKFIVIVMLLILPLFISCKDKKGAEMEKNMESLKIQMDILSKRLASIDERLYKAGKNRKTNVGTVAEPVKKQTVDEKPVAKINSGKFPSEFNYPEYGIKITKFKCVRGIGNIAAYLGQVSTEKDIQMLNLNITFFDDTGKEVGGHSFPVKVILAGSPKGFQNGDSIEGGFKAVDSLTLNVDFISYSDFRMKGRSVEDPQF